jgi:hypothetical protein
MFRKFTSPLILAAVTSAYNENSLVDRVPLSTRGSKIVDVNGKTVRLACVNWYGAHMERFVVNGLDLQRIDVLG